jgi:signal transduction histidine kinase
MKTQRYLLIWLSLFLPTVAIGVIALSLLAREQARLDELEANSTRAQAQTIADNADLIMAEIKTGVLLALEAASGEGNESARLSELSKTNPLVKTVYIWTPTQTGAYTRSFSNQSESAKQSLIDLKSPPWGTALPKQESITLDTPQKSQPALSKAKADTEPGYANSSYSKTQSKRANIREFTQQTVQNLNSLKQQELELSDDITEDLTISKLELPLIRRSGWVQSTQNEPIWIVWYQLQAEGRVTGAKLDTATVLEQLQNAYPYGPSQISYEIEAPHTETRYQSSLSRTATHQIPLGNELAGWHLNYTIQSANNGRSLLLLGSLLVAILCITSLGAGTLILWRARVDARDSAQKSTFVSNVSHELRTPLTTIRMYAEILEERRIDDPTKQQRYLSTITNESQRLTRLIDNVLDFSHLSQGRKRYQIAPVQCVDLIQSVLDSQEHRLHAAGMTAIWHAPRTAPALNSDCDALEQVLLNLVDNAIKYASHGKVLEITLKTTTSMVEISVSDQGAGIAARDRKKIFQAFQRLDESLTSNQPGSGLGLSICQGIIKDLGGQLKLTASASNGCCFTILLPLTPKHSVS